jgi:hypothetical protein
MNMTKDTKEVLDAIENTLSDEANEGVDKFFTEEAMDPLLKGKNDSKKVLRGAKGKFKRDRYSGKKIPVGSKPNHNGNRISLDRSTDLMEYYDGQRVVPIYEAFDDANGGMLLLTPYEHKFVITYTQTGNASRAAELAASDEDKKKTRNWRVVGYDLLRRPQVRQAVGYMQKKLCVAAALDSTEIIMNLREIAALAVVEGKFEAAIKANEKLGEWLGMFTKDQGGRPSNPKPVNNIVDIFSTGGEIEDNKNDIKQLGNTLGINFKDTESPPQG